MKIYLVPLVKGNFNKDGFPISKEKYYCCDYILTESSTFKIIFELPEVSEKLVHISDIEKMVSVHDSMYGNSSHGPNNIMCNIDDKIKPFTESLFIVFPSVEDVNSMIYPPMLEIIPGKTPIILLDIDGVINEYGSPDSHLRTVPVTRYFHSFNITYDPEKIKIINEWSKYSEVRFLTSWGDCATYRLAPAVGLYSFPHNYTGKHNLDELSEDDSKRPIIWIDDEIGGKYPYPSNFKETASKLDNIHVMYTPSCLKPYHFNYIKMMINPDSVNIDDRKSLLNAYIGDYKINDYIVTTDDVQIILDNFRKLYRSSERL